MRLSQILPKRLHYKLIRVQMKAALFRHCVTDKERKSVNRVAGEIIQSAIRNRGFPSYYFHSFLYRTEVHDIADYITDREIRIIKPYALNSEYAPFFSNKLLFHHSFTGSGLQLPRLLGYNIGSRFVPNIKADIDDFKTLSSALKNLPDLTRSGYIFIKPISGGKGKGCLKLHKDAADMEIINVLSLVSKGNYIFEEGLVQHPVLNKIYPHSINTARIISCRLNDGSTHLVAAKLRIGQDGMFVDNSSAGGISVSIDLDKGALANKAVMPYTKECRLITSHPDTNAVFSDYAIPSIEAVKDLVIRAASHIPYKLIGWDVAITDTGPVLIEGNERPHIAGLEMVFGGFKKSPIIRQFLKEATK